MSKKKNKFEDDIYLDAAIRKNELEGRADLSEAKAEIEKEEPIISDVYGNEVFKSQLPKDEEPEKKKKGKFLDFLAGLLELAPKIAETINLFKKKKS